MTQSECNWTDSIPFSIIGFLFLVLLIASIDQNWLLTPLTSSTFNRLSILLFSLLGGMCFFGMVTFGQIIYEAVTFIVSLFSRDTHDKRRDES